MNGEMLGSPNQDRLLPLVLNDQRRCVAVIAFGRRRVITRDLPGHFAGLFVKCGQPRLALMHACHDDVPIGQHGRSAMIPKQRVFPETLNEVGLPAHLPVEIDGRKCATFEVDEHGLSVRDGDALHPDPLRCFPGFSLLKTARHFSAPWES